MTRTNDGGMNAQSIYMYSTLKCTVKTLHLKHTVMGFLFK